MKRLLVGLSLLCFLAGMVGGYSRPLFAEVKGSESLYPGYSQLQSRYSYKQLNYSTNQYESKTADLKAVVDQLILLGTKLKNAKGMYVCPAVYAEYGLVVYDNAGKYLSTRGFGDPSTITRTGADGKTLSSNLEYRYLGYSEAGLNVTNDLRLNDSGSVEADSLAAKNWLPIDTPLRSWIEDNNKPLDYFDSIFLSPFISDDGTNTKNAKGVTLAAVLNPSLSKNGLSPYPPVVKGPDGTSVSGGARALSLSQRRAIQAYARLQVAPSLGVNGSVAIMHRLGTIAYYNTVILDSLKQDFSPKISISVYLDPGCSEQVTHVDLLPGETEKTVYVKVNSNLSMTNIGFVNQESDFIASVTNNLSVNGLHKGSPLTDLSNPSNMATVFPILLKASNYKGSYSKLPLVAEALIEPKTQILKVDTKLRGEGFIQVRVIPPQGISPEFDIYHEAQRITDSTLLLEGTQIDKDYLFSLKDLSLVSQDNRIVNWNWFVYNNQTEKDDYFAFVQHPSFSLSLAEVAKYVSPEGRLQFTLVVKDKFGKLETASHEVQFAPAPVKPATPKAHLDAPPQIKAGKETYLTASASITEGRISHYDFDVPSSVKILSGDDTHKTVAYLSYGGDVGTSMTVTADNGMEDTATARTEVLHPLEAYMRTNGVYKINRTIELDSTESSGTTYYPIDSVTWTIKPMAGQPVSSIKPHDPAVITAGGIKVTGSKPKVDFKALGQYEVWMDVHATCTYPGEGWRTASKQVYGVINIQPDQAPIALLSVPKMTIRDPNGFGRASFSLSSLSYSTDGDEIGMKSYYYRYDSDCDQSYDDEKWQLIQTTMENEVFFETPLVGHYEFRLEVEETNDSIESPFWNPSLDSQRDDSDSQPLDEKTTEVQNVAPITSVLADRKSVDLIVVTDYEGQALANLRSEGDALAKTLLEAGVNLKINYVSRRVKIGTWKQALNKYVRYGYLGYSVLHSTYPSDIGIHSRPQEWETRIQPEGDYLPNYGLTVPSSLSYRLYQDNDEYHTDEGYRFEVSAPSDPYKKNNSFQLQRLWGNAGGAGEWLYDANAFSFLLDGFFKFVGLYAYNEADLYGLDLDGVKTIPLRQGAERKLVLATEDSSALLKLDEGFKNWVSQNQIEVYTVGNQNIKDQIGYGPFDAATFRGSDEVIATTELGQSYTIGKAANSVNTDNIYPVRTAVNPSIAKGISFTSPTGSPLVVAAETVQQELCPTKLTNADEGRSLFQAALGQSDDQLGATDVVSTMRQVQYVYSGGNLIKKIYKAGPSNLLEQTDIMLYEVERYSITYSWPTYTRLIAVGKDKNGSPQTVFITASAAYKMVPTNLRLYDNGVAYFGNVSVKDYQIEARYYQKPPTKVGSLPLQQLYPHTANGMNAVVFYRNNDDGSYFAEKPVGMGQSLFYELSSGSGCWNYNVVNDDFKLGTFQLGKVNSLRFVNSRAAYFLSQDEKSLKTIVNNYDYDASVNGIILRTESEAIKQGTIELATDQSSLQACVLVTASGRLLGYGSSNGGRFGQRPGTFVRWEMIAKESRSVVNLDPVTAYDLISLSPKSSAFMDFSLFADAMKQAYTGAVYTTSMTRLLGETVALQMVYGDYESDPLYQSSFRINHELHGFDNSLGIDKNNGKTVDQWQGLLEKVGLYQIEPKVRDNPHENDAFEAYRLWNRDETRLNILVHRKPVALQRFRLQSHERDADKMRLNAADNGSYDLDHASEADRGITEVEWGFRAQGENDWHFLRGELGTQLTKTISRGDTYQLSYRVKDKEEQWSDPIVEIVKAEANLLLEAKLKAKDSGHQLQAMPSGEKLTLYDVWTSYELPHYLELQLFDGDEAIGYVQRIEKTQALIEQELYPEVFWKTIDFTLPDHLSEKDYRLTITAKDADKPQMSKSKSFNIHILNNRRPSVIIKNLKPQPLYWGVAPEVTLEVTDPDGDMMQLTVYCEIDQAGRQAVYSQSGLVSGSQVTFKIPKLKGGEELMLLGEVVDTKAAKSEAQGTWPIKPLGISQVKLTGAWQHWRGQKNGFGQQMTKEPYRFLGLESVCFEVQTLGNPDGLSLRLSPALEKMSFLSDKGKVYYYKDLIGKEQRFPIIFRQDDVNKYKIEYILPLAPSTISWANVRLMPPYTFELTLTKDGRAFSFLYGDETDEPCIDLTGNIYDLLYNQPIKAK